MLLQRRPYGQPTAMQGVPLSARLGQVLRRAFFSPLSRPERVPFFVDCIDRLEQESVDRAGELSRAETLQLISETLAEHGTIDWSDDPDTALADARARAMAVFNRLLHAGWLDDRDLGIDDRRVVVEPTVRWLLDALRKMSATEQGELHSFADTLRAICDDLGEPERFDPRVRPGEEMVASLGDLARRSETATNQLNHVYLILRRFIEKQGEAASGAENLRLVFDEFAGGQHQVCHDELFARGLYRRLGEARQVVEDLRWNYSLKTHLATALASREGSDEATALDRVDGLMHGLEAVLGGISAMAREVDGRVAHFHQVSYERYSYLNDRSGRYAEIVKSVFETIDARAEGHNFYTLPGLNLPPLLVPNADTYHGSESLLFPHQRRAAVQMKGGLRTIHADDSEAVERLRRRYNESLSSLRAARFIRQHLPTAGARIATNEFHTGTEDDLLDLLATLIHSRYGLLRWRVLPEGRTERWHPERTPVDEHGELRFARFLIERLN